jgi:hypothetical protein
VSLYLCAFNGDTEIYGVDVGSYDDFAIFRETVTEELENGHAGSVFPTLITHDDSDGAWPLSDLGALREELLAVVASPLATLHRDVNGSPLAESLLTLVERALVARVDILFQ